MLTNNFLYAVAGWMNGETTTIPTHVAWSSTVITPSATDTSIAHEYDRSSVTNSRVLNKATFSATRSSVVASSTGDYINMAGLFNAATTGTLFAEALVPSLLHTTTYDLELDWNITVTRG
jgi:hypothetical protein